MFAPSPYCAGCGSRGKNLPIPVLPLPPVSSQANQALLHYSAPPEKSEAPPNSFHDTTDHTYAQTSYNICNSNRHSRNSLAPSLRQHLPPKGEQAFLEVFSGYPADRELDGYRCGPHELEPSQVHGPGLHEIEPARVQARGLDQVHSHGLHELVMPAGFMSSASLRVDRALDTAQNHAITHPMLLSISPLCMSMIVVLVGSFPCSKRFRVRRHTAAKRLSVLVLLPCGVRNQWTHIHILIMLLYVVHPLWYLITHQYEI